MRRQEKIKKQKSEGCVGTGLTAAAMAAPPSWGTSESPGEETEVISPHVLLKSHGR